MSTGWIILIAIAGWVGLVALTRRLVLPWLRQGPQGDAIMGLMWRVIRFYSHLLHRLTFHGMEKFRDQVSVGPLIVVSNHTGAVDPLLIQAGCRFHIRWMMASEMISPLLDFVWERSQPIPVDRDGKDLGPAREAMRHVQNGGAVGIFPEGRIVSPPRQIRPFFTGVGLIVARTKAPVLLVWVSGTPDTANMAKSLITPSNARVQYIDLLDFKGQRDAHVITQQLRERLSKVSGWPMTDEPQP